MAWLIKKFIRLCYLTVAIAFFSIIFAAATIVYFNKSLPNQDQLKHFHPSSITQIRTKNGDILAEFSNKKRLYTAIENIPRHTRSAFLIAAKDPLFFQESKTNPLNIISNGYKVISNTENSFFISPIVQKVSQTILASNSNSYDQKIKETILEWRIEQSLSKDKIFELYLNGLYLGSDSYGITMAALQYFNKPITQLSISESALLAALSQSPTKYDPWRYYEQAIQQRNSILSLMEKNKDITAKQAKQAQKKSIRLEGRMLPQANTAPWFVDEVRKTIEQDYRIKNLDQTGLTVKTTLDKTVQISAEQALRTALDHHSRREGYYGPYGHIRLDNEWADILAQFARLPTMGEWQLAAILTVDDEKKWVVIGFADGTTSHITFQELRWAEKTYISPHQQKNSTIPIADKQPKDILTAGDVVLVQKLPSSNPSPYGLRQIPKANGAIIVMTPEGEVMALSGGLNYTKDQPNRATESKRQPGSLLTPFIYLSALESGYSPADRIADEPIDIAINIKGKSNTLTNIDQSQLRIWSPRNYSGQFYGPTTLRQGLEQSINVMSIHLGLVIGLEKISEILQRFSIYHAPDANIETVIGYNKTTLLSLTSAYAMLANGGFHITPSFISNISNYRGEEIFSSSKKNQSTELQSQISDPQSVYQVISMLRGATTRGTAQQLNDLPLTLAGKTGTSLENKDSWFIGFTPKMVVGIYIGHDSAASLGSYESGTSIALPAFHYFIDELSEKNHPLAADKPFTAPSNLTFMTIDLKNGGIPSANTSPENIILEVFKAGTEPTKTYHSNDILPVINSQHAPAWPQHYHPINNNPATRGTGGIY